MSADPDRLSVAWLDEARTDLRGIDRGRALEILYCLDRYLKTRNGDVKQLSPPLTGFRLRCGDYRLFFSLSTGLGSKLRLWLIDAKRIVRGRLGAKGLLKLRWSLGELPRSFLSAWHWKP